VIALFHFGSFTRSNEEEESWYEERSSSENEVLQTNARGEVKTVVSSW
jgi:hypothetical protein